jgi:hypothetical protein
MDNMFRQKDSFIRAKKRVKAIKGFYVHLIVYIVVNIFISGIIIFGLMRSGYNFVEAICHLGVYSTWFFWGIGMFFHWLGVFGSTVFFGKNWERKQLEKYMDNTKF